LERAVQYGAFSLAAMQRILAARSRPKTPLDLLPEDHRTDLDNLLEVEPTSPRPTSDYQALLPEEPCHDRAIIPPWEDNPESPEPGASAGDPAEPA
jgi:hypothetical protein